MINIFVIDDHPVFIDGIKANFADGEDNIKVSGWAYSAKEALPKLKRSRAKVVLLDLIMPEITGVEFCLVLKNDFPDKKVIALTGELNPTLLYNTWLNKADAILLKYCGKDELVDTIHGVLAGSRILGDNVPDFDSYFRDPEKRKTKLTRREQQILTLLAKGYSREKVGEILKSNKNAVNFHCHNMFRKYNTSKLVTVIDMARCDNLIV
jgi:DNA-binding NarL/FixJ family response regulator